MMTTAPSLQITTPSDREIAMTRAFDAPRHLVFEALTKPEWVSRWMLGPDGWTMPICQIDLKVGGAYRYVLRRDTVPAQPDEGCGGQEVAFGGEFREIQPPDRLVVTEKFDDYPGDSLVTWSLTEQGGQTTLVCTSLYDSKETRDAVLKSGMESGVARGYERLDDLLAAAQKR